MLNVLLASEAEKSILICEENRKKKLENSVPDAEADLKVEENIDSKEEIVDTKDDLNVLVNEIMESLTRLQESEYSYFSSCFNQLANLSISA